MGVFGIIRKGGTRVASRLGSNPRTTAAVGGGAAGGLLADDAVDQITPEIPGLDSNSSAAGIPTATILLGLGVIVALGQLFNINLGGS